eukprot:GEMP01080084.1.p1 GENE.GEMP01080084.1~~GEMP01080084.1.p1  ORF type:complete len:259 (+),score=38.72 GEMP01080084.1:212-988(+)
MWFRKEYFCSTNVSLFSSVVNFAFNISYHFFLLLHLGSRLILYNNKIMPREWVTIVLTKSMGFVIGEDFTRFVSPGFSDATLRVMQSRVHLGRPPKAADMMFHFPNASWDTGDNNRAWHVSDRNEAEEEERVRQELEMFQPYWSGDALMSERLQHLVREEREYLRETMERGHTVGLTPRHTVGLTPRPVPAPTVSYDEIIKGRLFGRAGPVSMSLTPVPDLSRVTTFQGHDTPEVISPFLAWHSGVFPFLPHRWTRPV